MGGNGQNRNDRLGQLAELRGTLNRRNVQSGSGASDLGENVGNEGPPARAAAALAPHSGSAGMQSETRLDCGRVKRIVARIFIRSAPCSRSATQEQT